MALLRELVAHARALGWPQVALDAQVGAIGFYERQGFTAFGDEFEDAGLPHRAMRLELPAAAGLREPPRDGIALPTGSRSEIAAARLLLQRLANPLASVPGVLLPHRLVIRRSA